MYYIKIYNDGVLYLDFGLDTDKREVCIFHKGEDTLLDCIFYNDFSFNRVMDFIESRVPKMQHENDLFEVLGRTRGRMYDDRIEFELTDKRAYISL